MSNFRQSHIRDAKSRAPIKFYHNIYVDGILDYSRGFSQEHQAKHSFDYLEQAIKHAIANGQQLPKGRTHKVEEAVGWKVSGKVFAEFFEALLYMWEFCPSGKLEGVFDPEEILRTQVI